MKPYLLNLNDVQKNAVTTVNGPVMVIAGPGSGKTRVLTYRIAHLIEEGVNPVSILALTFTNKAAREMQERISKVVGEQGRRVWAGTFHSLFSRILRIEAEKIGYPSDFTIYDTDDSKNVIKAIIKDLNLNTEQYQVNNCRSRISSAKTNLIPPRAYVDNAQLMMQDKQQGRPHFHKIYEEYVNRCKRSGAMDFDDLLYRLYELLHKNPENVLEKYRNRFQFVLVDEFQDTNYLQYAIVKKLTMYQGSPRNICIVGDDAQSIYAFRGATIENILNFQKDFPESKIFKLEQNYRSTEQIVQSANKIIQYNQKQIPKNIWSDKGQGQKIKLIKALVDTEEGKRVADTIVEQKNRDHLANKEIAILYRTNAQSRIFEEYLRRYNLPYKVFGGQSFYQRKEVKDMIAYLRLAVNPKDDEALRRVINYPKRGIGKSTIDKISAEATAANLTLWEMLPQSSFAGRTRAQLDNFITLTNSFRKKAKEVDAWEAAIFIANGSGLMKELREDKSIEGIGRLENFNALLDGIKEFVVNDVVESGAEMENDKSVGSYLQNIALITDLDEKSTDGDYITLMSVHAAKGLEFKSVFVVGLEEKLFPSFMSMDTPEGLDEERRLFYVAITRAEQFLTLTYATSRYKFGKLVYNEQSRFLEELPWEHVDNAQALSNGAPAAENKAPGRSSISGNFKAPRSIPRKPMVDPASFNPAPSEQIQTGQRVLHLTFGEGTVEAIDGKNDKRVATIVFPSLDSGQEKRIMLKFAKLQIL